MVDVDVWLWERLCFYALVATGYEFDRVVVRVVEVIGMTPEQVMAFRKSPQTVKARRLLCFWAQKKLGISTLGITAKHKISQPAAIRSSKREERIEREC